jgi:hypothetical protein
MWWILRGLGVRTGVGISSVSARDATTASIILITMDALGHASRYSHHILLSIAPSRDIRFSSYTFDIRGRRCGYAIHSFANRRRRDSCFEGVCCVVIRRQVGTGEAPVTEIHASPVCVLSLICLTVVL